MMSSCFGRSVWVALVLAMGGCQERADLGPDDDLELEGDAGRSIDPVVTPEVKDAGHAQPDATTVTPQDAGSPRADAEVKDSGVVADAGRDAGRVETDAGHVEADAGSEPPAASFAEVYALITASCTGCHGAGKTLDLSTPELAYDGMVGVEAQYAACVADGGESPLRVVPGDADASLLIAKLEGTQSCGKQMPPKALLEADKIAVFRAWVAAGAQQ
jgi:mono/diheme cytochrome c family protein